MSVKITLDAPALRTLIDDEMLLELRPAIVSEVVRNVVFKDKVKLAEQLAPDAFKALVNEAEFQREVAREMHCHVQSLQRQGWNPAKLSLEATKRLDAMTEDYLQGVLKGIAEKAQDLMQEAADKAHATIEERIEKRVDRLTNEYINAEVDKRVAKRLTMALQYASDAAEQEDVV